MDLKINDYIIIFNTLKRLKNEYDFTTLKIKNIKELALNTYKIECSDLNDFDSYQFRIILEPTYQVTVSYPLRTKLDNYTFKEVNGKIEVTKNMTFIYEVDINGNKIPTLVRRKEKKKN